MIAMRGGLTSGVEPGALCYGGIASSKPSRMIAFATQGLAAPAARGVVSLLAVAVEGRGHPIDEDLGVGQSNLSAKHHAPL